MRDWAFGNKPKKVSLSDWARGRWIGMLEGGELRGVVVSACGLGRKKGLRAFMVGFDPRQGGGWMS